MLHEDKHSFKPLDPKEKAIRGYEIDGRAFLRQNVSGWGMQCFFNATGLKIENQISKLQQHSNDPLIRDMIANEIVALSLTPEEISAQLKKVIDFEIYQRRQNYLNSYRQLILERLELIKNIDVTDQSSTYRQQERLDQKDDKNRQYLRGQSSTVQAFNAFIKHHLGSIGQGNNTTMMVMVPTIEQPNPTANHTSIDAIAHLNNLNLKVYQTDFTYPNGLRLSHVYDHPNSDNLTQTIYLYYDYRASHFQRFISY